MENFSKRVEQFVLASMTEYKKRGKIKTNNFYLVCLVIQRC